MPSIQHIAFGLGHLLAFGIADQAVYINMLERDLAGNVLGHHHHARYPEENNIKTGHQH
jgi:hypothetical protein